MEPVVSVATLLYTPQLFRSSSHSTNLLNLFCACAIQNATFVTSFSDTCLIVISRFHHLPFCLTQYLLLDRAFHPVVIYLQCVKRVLTLHGPEFKNILKDHTPSIYAVHFKNTFIKRKQQDENFYFKGKLKFFFPINRCSWSFHVFMLFKLLLLFLFEPMIFLVLYTSWQRKLRL